MNDKAYEELILDIFNYFSTKLPIHGQLVFTDREELVQDRFAATAPFGTVFVFKQVLLDFLKKINDEDKIKTLLTFIIGHECSHVNQYADFYRLQYSTDPSFNKRFYVECIENSNNENIIKIIYDNLGEIKSIFNFTPVMYILENVLAGLSKSAFKFIYRSNHDCLNEYYSTNIQALFHDDSYKRFPNIITSDNEVIKKDQSYLEMTDLTKISLDLKYSYLKKFDIVSSDADTLIVK